MDVYVAGAIPVFFTLIGVEMIAGWRAGRHDYRFNDMVTCLSCGMGHLMVRGLYAAGLLVTYVFAFERLAPVQLDLGAPWVWVVGFVAYDHQYYWWHRATHRSKLLWATHVQHHQSEDYNLAVALRQSWTSSLSSLPFYLPLAVLGVPPIVFALSATFDTLYQFWIHTELFHRLAPLDRVFNMPAHHRVHHAVDPDYVDKNYGGVFIVWDRLYGTFTDETHPATYGTVTPLRSFDPVWAQVGPFVALARELRQVPRGERLRYLLGPPEDRPDAVGGPVAIPVPEAGRITWDPRSEPEVHAYIAVQFFVVAGGVLAVLLTSGGWSWPLRIGMAAMIIWTTWVWGALFERNPHATTVELVRLLVVALAAVVLAAGGDLDKLAMAAVAYAMVSAVWVRVATAGVQEASLAHH